jgi:hypothetical protein
LCIYKDFVCFRHIRKEEEETKEEEEEEDEKEKKALEERLMGLIFKQQELRKRNKPFLPNMIFLPNFVGNLGVLSTMRISVRP